jgi:hypothetical protein
MTCYAILHALIYTTARAAVSLKKHVREAVSLKILPYIHSCMILKGKPSKHSSSPKINIGSYTLKNIRQISY